MNLFDQPVTDDSEAEVADPDERRRQRPGFGTVEPVHQEGIVKGQNREKTGKKAGKNVRPLQTDGKRNSQPDEEKATEPGGPTASRFGMEAMEPVGGTDHFPFAIVPFPGRDQVEIAGDKRKRGQRRQFPLRRRDS